MASYICAYFLFLIAFPLSAAASLQELKVPHKLVARNAAAVRELSISHWHVDTRGVPSFDYSYRQIGTGCNYQRDGHAEAGFGINGGTVELEIYNPEDADGKDGEQIGIFHDAANGVIVSMPLQGKASAFWMSFRDRRMKETLDIKCAFRKGDNAVILRE